MENAENEQIECILVKQEYLSIYPSYKVMTVSNIYEIQQQTDRRDCKCEIIVSKVKAECDICWKMYYYIHDIVSKIRTNKHTAWNGG